MTDRVRQLVVQEEEEEQCCQRQSLAQTSELHLHTHTHITHILVRKKIFYEYLPILTRKGFSLPLKGKVHANCVMRCLMHGSETWPTKVEHELKLNCTEMSMIRWMCGVKLNERKKSEEL